MPPSLPDIVLTCALCLLPAALLLLTVPVLLLSAQILAAQPRAGALHADQADHRQGVADTGHRPRIAVLVPAHNEATGIGPTLEALRSQLRAADQLLVVADNCSDDTAQVARAAGAITVERHDPDRIGKGYALDFGVRHLAGAPPQVLIIIDADCLPATGTLTRLAAVCLQTMRPVQGLYLMQAKPGAAASTVVAQFAWRVKNWLRPLGAARLCMGCQLMGSGMAFPWDIISLAPLASSHLVEDLALGLALAERGWAPVFCPEAMVSSVFPDNQAGADAQRTRWEHGHLSVILQQAPRLLLGALRRRDGQLALLALDLCIPPLSLLVLLVAASTGALLLAAWLGHRTALYAVALPIPLLLAVTLLVAWRKAGHDILPPAKLAHLAGYLLAKLPLYLRFLVRRQRRWISSLRDKQ